MEKYLVADKTPKTSGAKKFTEAYLEKLVRMYRFAEKFSENYMLPDIGDYVEFGEFSTSTSVIRYNMDHMEDLEMIQIFRNKSGTMFARGYRLLPLEKASPLLESILKTEKETA